MADSQCEGAFVACQTQHVDAYFCLSLMCR